MARSTRLVQDPPRPEAEAVSLASAGLVNDASKAACTLYSDADLTLHHHG